MFSWMIPFDLLGLSHQPSGLGWFSRPVFCFQRLFPRGFKTLQIRVIGGLGFQIASMFSLFPVQYRFDGELVAGGFALT